MRLMIELRTALGERLLEAQEFPDIPRAFDRVEWAGRIYQVTGEPAVWERPHVSAPDDGPVESEWLVRLIAVDVTPGKPAPKKWKAKTQESENASAA
jgi:hypothetical protein